MTKEEIIKGLKKANKWRRGCEKTPQPNPTDLGILIDEAINELEKHKWILVSDRLPTENDANMYSKVLSQKESGDIITMFFYQVTDQDFISWQPLPEPYKP